MSSNNNPKTPEQLADEQRRDVMAFAYLDKDGKYYGVNEQGERVEVALGSTLPDGTKIQTLTPEFHQVAESVAAVMMSYSKQLALSDADRGILSDLFQGKDGAVDKLSSAGKQFWETTKKTLGVTDFKIPGSGIVDAAGNVIDGLKAPFTAGGTLGGLLKEMADQVGGGEIDRAHALAIGTAYASAAQAAAQSDGGFTSHPFNWINAALHFAFSYVCDLFGIDKSHEWTSWHKSVSFAEEFANANRGDDNVRIEHEMGKLSEIGGVKTGELAMLTRPESTIRATDGSQVKVNSSDSTHAAPYTPDKPALTLDDAEKKQQTEPKPNIAERELNVIKNHDYTAIKKLANDHPILTGAAVAVSIDGARGTAKGFASQLVGENSIQARKANKLTKASDKAMDESIAAEKAGNSGKAEKKFDKAAEYESNAKKAGDIVTKREAMAGEGITEFAEKGAGKGWLRVGDKLGYKVGQATGYVTEHLGTPAANAIRKLTSPAVKMLDETGAKLVERYGIETVTKVTTNIVGKAIPIAGEIYMAKDDIGSAITATQNGDGAQAVRSGSRAVSGIAGGWGGAEAGATAGAAWGLAGGPLAEITVPVGAIAGSLLGYFGCRWLGGAAADAATGADNKQTTASSSGGSQSAPATSAVQTAEIDQGILAAIMGDKDVVQTMNQHPDMRQILENTTDEQVWRNTADKLVGMSGHRLCISGVKVSIGALNTAPASTPNAPVNHPSQPSTMIFS